MILSECAYFDYLCLHGQVIIYLESVAVCLPDYLKIAYFKNFLLKTLKIL